MWLHQPLAFMSMTLVPQAQPRTRAAAGPALPFPPSSVHPFRLRTFVAHASSHQVVSDSVDAVSAASCARQADVSFLVKKLAAVEQQLLASKAAALLHAGSALPLPPPQSLPSILAHKAAEAEAAAPRREVASAHADEASASQTMLLQQLLPLLQSSCDTFAALQANISQVGLSPQTGYLAPIRRNTLL